MLVADPEVVKLNVQSGQLDYADKFAQADLPVLKAGEAAGNYTTMLYTADLGAIVKYQFNITVADDALRPIFNDVRFREAMSLAVNRQEINDTIFFGLGVPRQWGVSSKSPFYEDWMGEYNAAYDVDKANALLDEMGLTKGADGIRVRPDGQPLRVILSDAINRVALSKLMAEYWTAVGVATQVNTVTRETFAQAVAAGEVQASVWFADVVSEKDMYTRRSGSVRPISSTEPCRRWPRMAQMAAQQWRRRRRAAGRVQGAAGPGHQVAGDNAGLG